jgi:hypothetical protein
MFVLGRNTRMMQRDPHLTEAMVRTFMFADTTAAEVQHVVTLMESMFAKALGITEPAEGDRDVFHLIGDVWMANLVARVTRRASAADVAHPPGALGTPAAGPVDAGGRARPTAPARHRCAGHLSHGRS